MTAIVNHRVNSLSNHFELQDRTLNLLKPVCEDYNLTLIGFDGETVFDGSPTSKVILDEAFGYYTDPSPHSPVSIEDPAWRVMAGTARGMWASRKEVSEDGKIVELEAGDDLIMAPFMSTGVRTSNHPMSVKVRLTVNPLLCNRTLTQGVIGTSPPTSIDSDTLPWRVLGERIPSTNTQTLMILSSLRDSTKR